RSRSSVFGSTSQSLIVSPARATADGTEKQVYAGITTSRRLEPRRNALKRIARAARPEETKKGFWTPRRAAKSSARPPPPLWKSDGSPLHAGSGAPAGATRRNRLKECS